MSWNRGAGRWARARIAVVAALPMICGIISIGGARLASAQTTMNAQTSPGAMSSAIQMPKIPGIALQAMPGYGVAPLTVGFMVTFPDPTVEFETWRWDFGDGHVSTLPPLMLFHTYKDPGSYVVTLTATTTDGLIATAQTGVIVRPATAQ